MTVVVRDTDKGFDAFFKNLKDIDARKVSVGIQGTEAAQIHPGGISMVDLASIHEFGAPEGLKLGGGKGIPQRSFFASTADANKKKYERAEIAIVKGLQKRPKSFNAKRELTILGETVRKDIIDRVRNEDIVQGLSASTIKKRGEDGPALIDTGLMIAAIRSVVT